MEIAHVVAAVRGGDATGPGDCIPLCGKHNTGRILEIIAPTGRRFCYAKLTPGRGRLALIRRDADQNLLCLLGMLD